MAKVRMAIAQAKAQTYQHDGINYIDGYQVKRSARPSKQLIETQVINALCHLYGEHRISSNWWRLEALIVNGGSLGKILSACIAALR